MQNRSSAQLDKAVNLYHDEKFEQAIALFEKLNDKEFAADLRYNIILGMCYNGVNNFSAALKHFKRAVKIAPDNETASMCLYLVYVDLDKSRLAIKELDRYLSQHPAKSYKVTLRELLQDLKKGNATVYSDTIFKYARKNKVKIPVVLLGNATGAQ